MKSIMVALSVVLLPVAANAYTQEQARLCTGDAFRLCGSEIPDVERVTVCMRAKKSDLSAGCKSVFDQGNATVQPVSNVRSRRGSATSYDQDGAPIVSR